MAKAHLYVMDNGIRIVTITLKKHIPSRLVTAGHGVLTAYDGQPETYYDCVETGHVYLVCPNRRIAEHPSTNKPTSGQPLPVLL